MELARENFSSIRTCSERPKICMADATSASVYFTQMALKAWEHLLVAYLLQPGPDAASAAEEKRTYMDMMQPVLRIIFRMVPGYGAEKESTLRGPHDRHLLLSEVDISHSVFYPVSSACIGITLMLLTF